MTRWAMGQQGLKSLFLALLILASCEAPSSDNPAEGCGGVEAIVSCLNVASIVPTSTVGGDSSNVDAFQEACFTPTTGAVSGEPFTDHSAVVTFTNTLFPTVQVGQTGFDIRITGYAVSYRLNQCPDLARGCPPLGSFTAGANLFIPAGQPLTITLPLVPLRVKNEYCAAGGAPAPPISYTATYTFTAQTTRLNDTFTVSGSVEFTIGDFLASGFACTGEDILLTSTAADCAATR